VLGIVFHTSSESWLKVVMLIALFGAGQCAVIVAAGSLTNVVQSYLSWTEKSKITLFIKRFAGALVALGGIYFWLFI
jgi:cytochrome c-type biogenesis protein